MVVQIQSKSEGSEKKDMALVFWDTNGIRLIDYLEKGKANNSRYFFKFWTH